MKKLAIILGVIMLVRFAFGANGTLTIQTGYNYQYGPQTINNNILTTLTVTNPVTSSQTIIVNTNVQFLVMNGITNGVVTLQNLTTNTGYGVLWGTDGTNFAGRVGAGESYTTGLNGGQCAVQGLTNGITLNYLVTTPRQ